jgi:hypothetical protein
MADNDLRRKIFMATILANVFGPFTRNANTWINYWFYPKNGTWQSGSTNDFDKTTLYPIARPWLPGSWDIEGDEVTMVLEEDMSGSTPMYRHNYALGVVNHNTTEKRSFFIATSELRP